MLIFTYQRQGQLLVKVLILKQHQEQENQYLEKLGATGRATG